ncbi:MAG: hypothetical protein ACH36H_13205 [Candidatus Nanopelagicales bacterium]
MTLQDAAADYAAAHHAHLAATARAQAASALHTAERTGATREAMGDAWRACDKAMRVMFVARDRLCEAAVDSGQTSLFGDAA